ncbi:PqqD family peptide modification chaperone [Spirosoma sp. SC4-14]|uniref:PqqD family peptide modification chaperone n=1 Tax=Spirosoma sp. SC4-14 TaxID=3128900 RepID=UPI0030CA8675
MNITSSSRIKRVSGQSSSVLGQETIVLNYEVGNYYELNEIGGFIWSLLEDNTPITVQEIKEKILDEFDVEESVCQAELMTFLESLLHEKLIEATV